MKILLTLKNWQLFLIMMGFWLTSIVFDRMTADRIDHPLLQRLAGLSYIFFMLVISAWMYTITNALAHKLPHDSKVNIHRTNACLFTIFATIVFDNFISPAFKYERTTFYFLLGIAVWGCAIYACYNVAFVITSFEGKKRPTLLEFLGVFIFIVGVWWLQPRINRIYKQETAPAIQS